MPELRRDPVSDRWVIIAPERADRPQPHLRQQPEADGLACPFCPGNEGLTPPEILVHRGAANPGGASWAVRVVPNRFPALRVETVLSRTATGLLDRIAGVGAHEVVIETSEHARTLGEMPREQLVHVLQAWQARMHDLVRDERLRYVQVFRNHGLAAGATLTHPHSQLVALPIVPREISHELAAAREHWDRKERCIFCDLIAQELADGARVVLETDGFVVLSPWAARSPFEVALYPREHRSHFEHSPAHELQACAAALRTVARKLEVALERPAWNLMLHTAPLREPRSPSYHWHLELKPVLTQIAGFEWGSGYYINPTPPEEAAAFLRQTEV